MITYLIGIPVCFIAGLICYYLRYLEDNNFEFKVSDLFTFIILLLTSNAGTIIFILLIIHDLFWKFVDFLENHGDDVIISRKDNSKKEYKQKEK